MRVKCPRCGTESIWEGNENRPFCSENCRIIDLGHWVTGSYRIPVKDQEGVFRATLDPRRPTVAPAKEEVPPHLNFAPLENAVEALRRSADRYAKAPAGVEGRTVPPDVIPRVIALLVRSERVLLSPEGLPRRPWFKHLLYAPGVYAGYGARTMPGAREAIELKRYSEADGEIARIAKVLQDEAALADEAAAALEKAALR